MTLTRAQFGDGNCRALNTFVVRAWLVSVGAPVLAGHHDKRTIPANADLIKLQGNVR